MTKKEIFKNGVLTNNPLLISLLGICPALAVSDSLNKAFGMSVAIIFTLFFSNLIISLIRKIIPQEIRIPVYITIIASFVTIISLIMEAFTYDLFMSMGVFLPLVTVNCILLARAEAFASKNTISKSIIDALGNGIGYSLVLILMSFFRELIGSGHINIVNPFNNQLILTTINSNFFNFIAKYKLPILQEPAGAFIVLSFFIALSAFISNKVKEKKLAKEKINEHN